MPVLLAATQVGKGFGLFGLAIKWVSMIIQNAQERVFYEQSKRK